MPRLQQLGNAIFVVFDGIYVLLAHRPNWDIDILAHRRRQMDSRKWATAKYRHLCLYRPFKGLVFVSVALRSNNL